MCAPDRLVARLADEGLVEVASTSLDVPAVFGTFDEHWTPFLGGQGLAAGYVATLFEPQRLALGDRLESPPSSRTARFD
jgi:hypothetical protein